MITLHFHLLPQYKYELFYIYFTWSHCTGRYELNKLTLLPMCGFIAQLVEHRTGIAEVMGSNPVEALFFFVFFFFQASSFQLLKLENLLRWSHFTLISSCVLNNGFATNHFNLSRGVRQGCPLSGIFFFIGVEILSNAVKRSKEIEGIQIDPNKSIKK